VLTSVIGLKTSKSGNATSTELVLGSDTRLTNSRTPSSTLAHAASHHTGGSDALTAANIGAAPAVNVIELEADGTTTITTAQLPARGIAYADGGASFTVNLPTPDKRQSGLAFSIKTEHEGASGDVFVTVVHAAVNLLTSYELTEDEGSIDFVWDGYAWRYDAAYLLRSFPSRVLELPAASGTIARTEDFAAPPAIGNTTPNTGAFTTLSANNGTLTASAPVLDLAQTWNNSGVTFTGILATFTNTASNAASRLIDLRVGADSFFSVNRSGTITGVVASGGTLLTSSGSGAFDINASGGARIRFAPSGVGGRMLLWSGTGKYQFFPSAATANTSLGLFVSTEGTNNVMALENATNPQTFRIYNTYTSATNFERLNVRWASNELIIDAEAGSAGGTLRGIKLGSAATSLLGFFGATPVVQQAAVADATDAATAITQLNDLLAAMRTLGLIAT
jgi:hypothetical protein